MIYFDTDILRGIHEGYITIKPFIQEHLGVNSYDVRLADKLLVYEDHYHDGGVFYLDMRRDNPTRELQIPEGGLILMPGKVYLGSTMEWVGTSAKCVPHLEGRSSIGRLGMSVHVTAGFGDCGFQGCWTMEITVVQPVKVYAGERVAQAYFIEGKGTPAQLYKGKYHSFEGPIASRMYRDERKGTPAKAAGSSG